MKTGTLRHVKTLRLKRRLGNVPDYVVAGILTTLWDMTAEQCPAGDIGRFTDEDIAAYMGWTGPEGELIDALVESGWLDRDRVHRLIVHDWEEHCSGYIRKRVSRRKEEFVTPSPVETSQDDPKLGHQNGTMLPRTAGERVHGTGLDELSGQNRDTVTVLSQDGRPTQPNPTQPNPTQPNNTRPLDGTDERSEGEGETDEFKSISRELVDRWNSGNLTACRKMTDSRQRALRARLKSRDWRGCWRDAVSKCHESSFCNGNGPSGWKADLDWFLKPETVTKVMEGKYDEKRGQRSTTGGGNPQGPTRISDSGNRQAPEEFDGDELPF